MIILYICICSERGCELTYREGDATTGNYMAFQGCSVFNREKIQILQEKKSLYICILILSVPYRYDIACWVDMISRSRVNRTVTGYQAFPGQCFLSGEATDSGFPNDYALRDKHGMDDLCAV